MRRCFLITLFTLILVDSPAAEWAWQVGDVVEYDAANTSGSIQERVQQATESNLDWVVLAPPPESGLFVGLSHVLQEAELSVPRLTPIVGTGWASGTTRGVVFGIDPRTPVPGSLDRLLTVVEAQRGVLQLDPTGESEEPPPVVTAVRDGKWAPLVEPGGAWDDFLETGTRVFIAGSSAQTPAGRTHRTYVKARSNEVESIITALRNGRSFVAERDGIRVDFEVQGRSFGETAFFQGEAYVRIGAHARDPISRVTLIADGEVVWTTRPDTTVWSERFFLPLHHHSYVWPVLESESGDYRTLGNPVFLIPDRLQGSGEVPYEDPSDADDASFIEVSGTIEASARLSEGAQKRILAEFLSNAETRYPTVWLLQNRNDLIGDDTLLDLTADVNAYVRLGAAYALLSRGNAAPLATMLRDEALPARAYAGRMTAQYTEGFGEEDWPPLQGEDPIVVSYLIRAYRPVRHHPEHIARLIGLLDRKATVVSSAAADKVVTLGARNYRVISVLVDSARAGHARAIDALGLIGDHRSVAPLLDIFRQASHGPLKRATFDALTRMNVPYQDRHVLEVPELESRPTMDGHLDSTISAVIGPFAQDSDARPPSDLVDSRVGRYDDSLYVGIHTVLGNASRTTLSATGGVHDDHRIEISLSSPDGRGQRRYGINALGLTNHPVARCPTGSRVHDGGWTLEALVPLSDQAQESVVRFNLYVVSSDDPASRLSWSVTYGAPHDTDRYGDLRFTGTNPPARDD